MRARNIKPGFFSNDQLAGVNPFARLLFIGLWCAADRAGRLQDRPLRIKAEVLPYDECDVDKLLDDLCGAGLIERYQAGGCDFIQVTKFPEHQSPHIKERESTIPAPDGSGADPVQASYEPDINPPDSGFSDSGLLIPDPEEEKDEERAREAAPAGHDDEQELTVAERTIAGYVREIRGMANVPAAEIIGHIRECLDIRGSPLSELTMRREFQKFRDHHNSKRSNQPTNQRWRGWKNAISNWMARIPDDSDAPGSMLDALYPDLSGDEAIFRVTYGDDHDT